MKQVKVTGSVTVASKEGMSVSDDLATTQLHFTVESPTKRAVRRLLQNRLAVVGMVILGLLVLSAVLAPFITPHPPNEIDLDYYRTPPSPAHPLGTDRFGRDVLSRILYGGRLSLSVGFLAVLAYEAIAIVLGAISGYFGGKVDLLIMRAVDLVMCFPSLIVILFMVAVLGPGFWNVMIAIALLTWTGPTRLVRGQYLSEAARDYVVAAKMLGAKSPRIMLRHILPSIISPVLVHATFGVAGAILTESALSFLGLGVALPTATWGTMMGEARELVILETMPWLWVPPGIAIVLTVLAVSFVGDGLRDALDPRVILQ